ncbi:TPA: DUF2977 domain-containing protein [Staphylococcus aureus]|uniref:DUF2977 domain-containing protein n=1 Tax=Staphylococcus aureus TaxID=1280 RepID=UPI00085BCA82|nr:DUF2977 domain-containing protein [Staphylococcus aureus]SCT63139.1 SLT orf 129-like protein [Staphylococcus aureus]HDG8514652.1 DUF2977 domain-containing protein [Staphylococcus aureus]HDG8526673.1 DUF2977 domain-containing protein [Staphylococcus aureus]
MKITVNDKNEVIGYVNTGGLRNSLDVDDNNVPTKFKEEFEPRKFVFTNGEIKYNSNFDKEEQAKGDVKPSLEEANDDELRGMVASLLMQMTQVNVVTQNLAQQNANLTATIAQLQATKSKTEGGI